MTLPEHTPAGTSDSKLIRIALWVAIGAMIVAALVCVVWVVVGAEHGLVGRAFFTILMLAAFAGVTLLDTRLAPRRPAWFALLSMIVWVVILLLGAFLIWMPGPDYFGWGIERFISFLLIVLVLQLALLHVRLYLKAHARYVTTFTRAVAIATLILFGTVTVLLVAALAFDEFAHFTALYWRFVLALAILAAVGTALIPLVNALFAPKPPRGRPVAPVAAPYGYAPTPYGPGSYVPGGPYGSTPYGAAPSWPTYADGVTPLPVLPDGSPDWNAYYTGYPSTVPQAIAPVAPLPSADRPVSDAPGYQGYPPPPPLPPRP